jgi:site-specific DNA-adenine methylase
MTYNTLIKMHDTIQDTVFANMNYREFLRKVIKDSKKTYVVYMDPPYKDTCTLPYAPGFDNKEFWDIVREYSKQKNVIMITSELTAPKDFLEIFSFNRRSGMHNASTRIDFKEKLFVLRPERIKE